nr:HNH endonuclease signature motif containing protein [Haloechinothrix aidingensis]
MFVPAGQAPAVAFTPEEQAEIRCRTFTGEQVGELSAEQVIETLAAARRIRAHTDAIEAHALARLDQLRGGDRYVADEAALELRVSRHTAALRLHRARQLTQRMPRVLAAMEAGQIEAHAAGRVVEATDTVEDQRARQVDTQLAEKLDSGRVSATNPANLARAARRLVEQADPEGQATRARQARAGRKVELLPGEDGLSTLAAELPAEVAASAYARIDAMAHRARHRGDERTLDQLRADIHATLLLGQDPDVAVPEAAATVFLHMPVDAALGMTDTGCELSGYGPLPAPIARQIMGSEDSVWRKVLTDPASGAVLDVGRRRYRPTTAIRDLVAVRDAECTAPGCHRPAQHSDYDHLHGWGRGQNGSTAEANGGAKCRWHHRMKDHPHWTLHHNPSSGTSTITTPTGRRYTHDRTPGARPRPPTLPEQSQLPEPRGGGTTRPPPRNRS